MTVSADLQGYAITTLKAAAAVTGIVSQRIDNRAVPGPDYPLPYVVVLVNDGQEDDAECITGTVFNVEVHCWGDNGPTQVLLLADAVKKALHKTSSELATGALVDLWFDAVLNVGDPDPNIHHRVVRFSAIVEEM
ncbi:MAG: DUF3168 domain-containing protein [Rhizobiaceae bacterium]|nr:DUF3168 domain-containing protein [Rhizobiaceae bacterium]MCV0406326.1 DUF3168 domain-containing protein [Rhizobiaceae bacterium]